MLFRSREQQETVDYVKAVKTGKASGRTPDNIKSSEATIKNWIKSGTNMPSEFESVQSQKDWNAEFNSSNESKNLSLPFPDLTDPEDIFATVLVSGFGLGLLAMVNPALVPVVLSFIGKGLVGVGATFTTTGFVIDKIKSKAMRKGQ
jgi:hypothetical protein